MFMFVLILCDCVLSAKTPKPYIAKHTCSDTDALRVMLFELVSTGTKLNEFNTLINIDEKY